MGPAAYSATAGGVNVARARVPSTCVVGRGRVDPSADSDRAQEGRMSHEAETNPYLLGNFGPWRLEGEALDLEVVGRLPDDLAGTYFRNGPNPAYPPLGRYHWFDGDGMVHAIRLENGRAHYRNRWVRSRGLEEEREAGRALYPGLLDLSPSEAPRFKNTGNTNIVA